MHTSCTQRKEGFNSQSIHHHYRYSPESIHTESHDTPLQFKEHSSPLQVQPREHPNSAACHTTAIHRAFITTTGTAQRASILSRMTHHCNSKSIHHHYRYSPQSIHTEWHATPLQFTEHSSPLQVQPREHPY